MLDKMTRVENMVTKLCLFLEISQDVHQIVQDGASLAMSDLATAVVTEFTSLSGIMGRHYALRDGYSEQVVLLLMSIIAILFYNSKNKIYFDYPTPGHCIWLLLICDKYN